MERAGNEDTDPDAERRGLGTPATRAAVIEKLVKGGFIERKGKQLLPTKDGTNLVCVLPDSLTSPQLTAAWENNLTQIAKGAADPGEFLSGIEAMARELVQTHAAALDGKKDLFREEKPSVGKCPRCGAEFKNESKYRTFRCTACGNTVKYNTDGTLSPSGENDKCFEFVSEWYKFQRDEVKKEVENPDYSFEENVTLLLTDDKTHRFEEAGKGKIVLDKNGITYVGTKCGQEISRTFGLKNHPTVAYKLAQNIEIAEDNEIFKFVFENGFHTAKFVLAVEELHKKYVENAK